jgi:hypothetical protein
MSTSFISPLADLVVSSGTNASRVVDTSAECHDAAAIAIISPGTLDSATWTLEVSFDGSTFATLHDGTANFAPPPAGSGRQYTELLGFPYWRIKSSANAAANRTFKVSKLWLA